MCSPCATIPPSIPCSSDLVAVTGLVTDANTSNGIDGATVTCSGPMGQVSTTTDSSGLYSLTVKQGPHILSAEAAGYVSDVKLIRLPVGPVWCAYAAPQFFLTPV